MIKTLIVAVDKANAIGKDGDLPWHLPNDMKHFKQTTTGHHVIMGRKNYESIPTRFRPLPNRVNILITRNKSFEAPDCIVAHSAEEALAMINPSETEVFIIGGASIYDMFLPQIDKLILTEVHTTVDGADTFLSELNWDDWKETERENHLSDERHLFDYSFVTYLRK